MLKGIDISNWQQGFDVKNAPVDFVIVKATEGDYFVDAFCDGFVQQAKESKKLWGFYHFANNNSPETEAQFFYENCKGYFNEGIPILDIEDNSIASWGDYAQRFAKKLHEITGVWCMIYCSASQLYRFNDFPYVYNNCGLWVAGYPQPYTEFIDGDCPYDISPWQIMAIWQFTSSLQMQKMNIDGNIAYMDERAWQLYAGKSKEAVKPIDKTFKDIKLDDAIARIAMECINGTYGNDEARKNNIYNVVQDKVNYLINGGGFNLL